MKKLTIYEKVYAYTTTWAEMLIDRHPVMSAVLTALIIDKLIWG